MSAPPISHRQRVFSALSDGPASAPQMEALGMSRRDVLDALRVMAPALRMRIDEAGRKWYRITDMPLAERLSAPRQRGRPGHIAGAAAAHMEPGVWRSTGRLAREMEEDVKLLYRALKARPDLFKSRPFKGHRLWALRDDG